VAYHADHAAIMGGHRSILGESKAAGDQPGAATGWRPANLANLLTLTRFAAAAGWAALFFSAPQHRVLLGTIAAAAAISDIFDGRVARRFGTSGAAGRWLDGIADVTFVLTVLGCEAAAGAIPWYVPALIAASFAQYALDSIVLGAASAGPIRSRLGHWGGVINYALALVLAFAPPPHPAGAIVRWCAPILALYYLAAITERAMMYPQSWRTRLGGSGR
jgi:CDP-diacylglycerol---glycerol-3-phosphate 3-phosphatidyltransferase